MAQILIVDDHAASRRMLARRLERLGYVTAEAANGAEAVDAASQLPDLILMDLDMPVMDGWEATQRIKSNPETAAIPVIALTAHAMAGDRERAVVAGADEYDTKPIDLPVLAAKIEALLGH